jgi:ribosomal protein S18 acetylase RimI-like enzyme
MTERNEITVTVAGTADPELHEVVLRLVPQLSSSALPTFERLRDIIEGSATTLLLARSAAAGAAQSGEEGGSDGAGQVVGMLTLVVFTLPTGIRAWIEDVVVDAESRGGGVASALILAAIELADQMGARTVDLTSRPVREAANRLYVRLGFTQRETNVYRRTLSANG